MSSRRTARQTGPVPVEQDVDTVLRQLRDQERTKSAVLRSDDDDQAVFQRICRDYNRDGTCDVLNRAVRPGMRESRRRAALDAERQAELRLTRLDEKINNRDLLPDSARVEDMTGAEVRRAWNTTRWYIDPEGTTYGNPGTGAVDFDRVGGVVSMELGALRDRQAYSRGEQNYQFFHDSPGHTSSAGRRTQADMQFRHFYADPRTRDGDPYDETSPYFVEEETAATRRARALARLLNEPFEYSLERGY